MLKWLEVKFIFCRSLFLLGFLSYLHTNPVNAFIFSSRADLYENLILSLGCSQAGRDMNFITYAGRISGKQDRDSPKYFILETDDTVVITIVPER